jgi:hypothetical protein
MLVNGFYIEQRNLRGQWVEIGYGGDKDTQAKLRFKNMLNHRRATGNTVPMRLVYRKIEIIEEDT